MAGIQFFGNHRQFTADTLGAKTFVKITLSHTVSEKNAFLRFTWKFKMATKNGRKTIFWERGQLTLQIPWGLKFCQNRSILHHVRDKSILAFYAGIQDGQPKKWRENNFWGKVTTSFCEFLGGKKFQQNCSISHCFRDKSIFVF